MHLNLLSDATFSDLPDKAGRCDGLLCDSVVRLHFEGLLRGLVFASALLTPFALTFIPAAFSHSHPPLAGFEVRP